VKNLLFSLFAIGVAAVAAMTATTAMINAPHREDPASVIAASQAALTQAQQEAPPPASGKPAGEGSATPAAGKPEAKPAGAAGTPAADTQEDEEGDKDPYEGIPEEELPPDMQYSADSSVSFPTNI
jgi:hypothetical protein